MAEFDQDEYIDTSEFLEPEDSMEISSDFTDITPIKKTVIIKERNPPLRTVVDTQVRFKEGGRQIASV